MYKLISIKKNKRDDFQLLLRMNGCRPPLHVLLDIKKKIYIYIYKMCRAHRLPTILVCRPLTLALADMPIMCRAYNYGLPGHINIYIYTSKLHLRPKSWQKLSGQSVNGEQLDECQIQTHKRFKRTLFIRTKTLEIFGVIPFIKLQNDT